MRSSISSSEKSFPRKGVPKAVFGALALVVLLEISLHLVPGDQLLGYGAGLGSYYDVAHSIQDMGPADIAILGTSRARESIVVPELKNMIAEETGQHYSVANYGCAGSHADEMNQVANLLLSGSKKPKMVFYFLSPGILKGEESNSQRLGILGVYPDFFGGRSGQVIASEMEYPFWKVRQWLDRHYLTFRHRHRFRYLITSLIRRREPLSCVQGDYSTWQKYSSQRSLKTHPVSAARVQGYVARLFEDSGQYVAGEIHVRSLENTIQAFEANGVPLFVFQASISPDLARYLPDQVTNEFQGKVRGVMERTGGKFWTNEDLGLELGPEDFREQSHMNLSGARKLTRALFEQIVRPQIEK